MVLWIAAVCAAYYVKGICGFANTLIITVILSFGENNITISPVELLLGLPSNALMVWRERRSLQPRVFVPLCLLVIAGSLPGIFLLKNADAVLIKRIFGCVTVLLGLEMLLRWLHPGAGKQNRAVLAVIGVVSGLLCGLYGIGALLSAYISRVTDNARAFRANLCAVFVVEALFRAGVYGALGILSGAIVRQAALLLPFSLASLWLGMRSAAHISERRVRLLVILLLIFSGAVLVVFAAR